MSHSEPPSEPHLSHQNNQPHISPENTNNQYRPELTIQQAAFLTKLLPPGYSFQLDPKTLKRSTSSVKNFKEEPRLPPEVKKKSVKVTHHSFRMNQKTSLARPVAEGPRLAAIALQKKIRMLFIKNIMHRKISEETVLKMLAKH
jgi:hypothetical protein